MRIDSIEIINYRQYIKVRYEFAKKGTYDLHIIKGKNGMGKTNLLNAITWCLYNKEPHLGIKNSGKPRLNTTILKKAKTSGIEKCNIMVKITISGNGNTIIFERNQDYGIEGKGFDYKSNFIVTDMGKDGLTKVFSDDEIPNNYVNMYMPQDIREYFFFDGEQLEKYFISDEKDKIKEAIHVISQVKLLSIMKNHLKNIIGELQTEAGKKNKSIDSLIIQKKDIENKIDNSESIIIELERQITISNNQISQCTDFLKGKEGVPEKEKEFEDLQNKIIQKSNENDNIDIEIHKFIRRYKTLFAFYPSIIETYNEICKKELEGVFPTQIDKNYLKRMLSEHKCLVCNRELKEHDEEFVKQLLKQLALSSESSYILSKIKGELENLIDESKKYKIKRDKLFNKKKNIELDIKKINERLIKLDAYLKQFSDKEKIKDFHKKRIANMKLLEINNRKLVTFEIEVKNMKSDLNKIKKQIEKDMNAIKDFEEINRKISFAERANKIVSSIEMEMMYEAREEMQIETMRIFSKLEWKKNAFNHIELDELYNLELFDIDGFPTVGTCSAGERALLALSFTLALQKVAGYDSMLLIDTPVGRIDSDNRANFSEVLKNVSINKQVIITLTTSEYSKEIQQIFEPIASSFVELITKDDKVTTISEVI